jgi:hypothetical protein
VIVARNCRQPETTGWYRATSGQTACCTLVPHVLDSAANL